MVIDADCHISPNYSEGEGISYDELLRQMDRSGVDQALIWLQPPYLRVIEPANAYIHQAVKNHPDRLLGFGWVDPHFGRERALEMAKKCLYEYDFYGVKLNGAQNSFYIDDPSLSIPIIEEVAKSGKWLAFHIGADAYEYTHPFRVGKIARLFPDLLIFMVHMGGAGLPDLSKACIEIAQEHPNLYLIGSAVGSRPILQAIQALGSERVCFGSDTPFEWMHVAVARYHALLDGEVSAREKDNVMSGNIRRLFAL